MKILRIISSAIISFVMICPGLAQSILADIEGDLKVKGKIELNGKFDTTLVMVGYQAGQTLSEFEPVPGGSSDPNVFSTFVGSFAGESTFLGINNSFFGYGAGIESSSGSDNSFFGVGSGAVTLASQNSFYGSGSGVLNSEGWANSFFGYRSGFFNTQGNGNAFYGWAAGLGNSTGNENTYIGAGSGHDNTKGSGNTFIGYNAGPSSPFDSLNNAIAIGHQARVECDNCAVIGGARNSNNVRVGVGVTMPQTVLHLRQRRAGPGSGIRMDLQTAGHWNIYLNPNKKLNFAVDSMRVGFIDNETGEYMEVSDIKHKRDIQPIPTVLESLLELRPYTYQYKRNKTNNTRVMGLIAQDVQQYFPELVSESEETLAVAYSKMGVIAIKAIQEQQKIIEDQARLLKSLEKRLAKLESPQTQID